MAVVRSKFNSYILMVINSPYFRKTFVDEVGTTTINQITQSMLKNFLIPLPPLAEQERIVERLEKILAEVELLAESERELDDLQKNFPCRMKNSILQAAIQGKLTEQLSTDGDARELLKKIREEKSNLTAEGKIKSEKILPPITADEIPFDIPKNWQWVRLGEIVSVLGDGIHGTPEYDLEGKFYFINGNNLSNGKILIKSDTKRVNQSEYEKYKKFLDDTSILVSINGTLGNVAFYDNEKIILGKSACYFNLMGKISKHFIKILLGSKFFLSYANEKATGSTIKNVSLKAMKNFIVPLPPLAEQKRIVERLEELLPLCEI